MRTIPAGEFKAKCLGLMTEMNATGQPVLVTKRGKPFARVSPVEKQTPKESPESIFGCLRHMGFKSLACQEHLRGHCRETTI